MFQGDAPGAFLPGGMGRAGLALSLLREKKGAGGGRGKALALVPALHSWVRCPSTAHGHGTASLSAETARAGSAWGTQELPSTTRVRSKRKALDQSSRWKRVCAGEVWGLDPGLSVNVLDSSCLEQTDHTFAVQDRLRGGLSEPCLEQTEHRGSVQLSPCQPFAGLSRSQGSQLSSW